MKPHPKKHIILKTGPIATVDERNPAPVNTQNIYFKHRVYNTENWCRISSINMHHPKIPIGSMYMLYIPTLMLDVYSNLGKYTISSIGSYKIYGYHHVWSMVYLPALFC